MVNKKSSILIVEDEKVVSDFLYKEMSEQGYLCEKALNGNDAFAKLAMHYFDVILLDIRLPGMSGLEILKSLRLNHMKGAIIMITAINDANTVVEAMRLGAVDYIVKPFTIDRVNAGIRLAMNANKYLPKATESEQPVIFEGTGEEKKHIRNDFFNAMNAIARGVAAKYDLLTGYSMMIIQRTVEIAQRLGIPDEEIQRWTDMRLTLSSETNRSIETSMKKLVECPVAEIMIALAEKHSYTPRSSEHNN